MKALVVAGWEARSGVINLSLGAIKGDACLNSRVLMRPRLGPEWC